MFRLLNRSTWDKCGSSTRLSPILWNILYNDVFEIHFKCEAKTIRFSYDLSLIVVANNKYMLIQNVNENLKMICKWVWENKLILAPEKTKAIILWGKEKEAKLFSR